MAGILKVWKELNDGEKSLFIITTLVMFIMMPIVIVIPFYDNILTALITIITLLSLTISLTVSKIKRLAIPTGIMLVWTTALTIFSISISGTQVGLITGLGAAILFIVLATVISFLLLGLSNLIYLIMLVRIK